MARNGTIQVSSVRFREECRMPSPFPGMDPFLETNPIFQELHTQMLAEMQALLQPQLRRKYIARLERHLSEGSEELDTDELELRKQRRIVIYVQDRPRLAVTGIELLSPGNKQPGAVAQERYLEKRASALHGGLHWVEIDLLRGGARPPIPVPLPEAADYLCYVAQATPTGWNHLVYAWTLRERLPALPIPLLGEDQAQLDLGACFAAAYDRIAADDEVNYARKPPLPSLRKSEAKWMDQLLREHGAARQQGGAADRRSSSIIRLTSRQRATATRPNPSHRASPAESPSPCRSAHPPRQSRRPDADRRSPRRTELGIKVIVVDSTRSMRRPRMLSYGPVMPTSLMNAVPPGRICSSAVGTWVCVPRTALTRPLR